MLPMQNSPLFHISHCTSWTYFSQIKMSTLYHAKKEICSLSSVCQIVQGKNFVQNSITFLLNSKDLWLLVAYLTTLGFSWCTLTGISEDKLTQEESSIRVNLQEKKTKHTTASKIPLLWNTPKELICLNSVYPQTPVISILLLLTEHPV